MSVEVESHIGQDKTDTSTTNKISRYEAGQNFFSNTISQKHCLAMTQF
jgi:hypothetical protein